MKTLGRTLDVLDRLVCFKKIVLSCIVNEGLLLGSKKNALLNTCGLLLVSRKLIAVFLSDSFRMKYFSSLHIQPYLHCA